MRQILSRDNEQSNGCEYNSNTSNMDWYTYPSAADTDTHSHYYRAGHTYWISVTGARNTGEYTYDCPEEFTDCGSFCDYDADCAGDNTATEAGSCASISMT